MDELLAFLSAALDEDWMWASEASRHRDGRQPTGGAHWHWVCAGHDEVVNPEPGGGEFMQCSHGDWDVSLRSVEQYPSRSLPGVSLPTFVIRGSEEVQPVHGGHIARWDPARVLAEVEAKRARIDLLAETAAKCPEDDWPEDGGMEWAPLSDFARHLLKLEAQPFASRPGFRDEWRLT